MALKTTEKHNELRNRYMSLINEFLADKGEDILITGSNELTLPVVDCEGGEEFLTIKFIIPKGSRDGEAYDGYSMAEDYQIKQKEKAEKAEKAKAEKEKKIARDKKMREQKAKMKAEREGK